MGISRNGVKSISEEDLVRNARKNEIPKCEKNFKVPEIIMNINVAIDDELCIQADNR